MTKFVLLHTILANLLMPRAKLLSMPVPVLSEQFLCDTLCLNVPRQVAKNDADV